MGNDADKADKTERVLIGLLQEDGRQPVSAMARQLNLPISTVRRRISRLLANGTIRVVAIPDTKQLGLPVHVIMGIQVDLAQREAVGEALVALPEIRWVAMTAGQYDYLIEAFLASQDHFHHLLTQTLAHITGIQRAETMSVVRLMKNSFSWSDIANSAATYHDKSPP